MPVLTVCRAMKKYMLFLSLLTEMIWIPTTLRLTRMVYLIAWFNVTNADYVDQPMEKLTPSSPAYGDVTILSYTLSPYPASLSELCTRNNYSE